MRIKGWIILGAVLLSGCGASSPTTVKALLGANEAVIVDVGSGLTRDGCRAAAIAAKLQPAELTGISAAVNACSQGIAAAIPVK